MGFSITDDVETPYSLNIEIKLLHLAVYCRQRIRPHKQDWLQLRGPAMFPQMIEAVHCGLDLSTASFTADLSSQRWVACDSLMETFPHVHDHDSGYSNDWKRRQASMLRKSSDA